MIDHIGRYLISCNFISCFKQTKTQETDRIIITVNVLKFENNMRIKIIYNSKKEYKWQQN